MIWKILIRIAGGKLDLKEFSTPIRVYWDLPGINRDNPHFFNNMCEFQKECDENMGVVPSLFRICTELIDLKVLNLNLLDRGPSISKECLEILERLENAHIAISLTVSASALDRQLTSRLKGLNVRALLVGAVSLDDLKASVDAIKRNKEIGLSSGVSFKVDRDNYQDLPEVLSLCVAIGSDYLVIPMQRLMEEGECFYITGKERQALEAKLSMIAKPESMRIVINDPFLWSAFFPEAQYPEAGCQAANSMLYISPGGDVYPCPAMPVKLGSLKKTTLGEIICSAEKREIRRLIIATPGGCSDCKKLKQCLGGCRGRAYAVRGSVNELDPACG